MYSQRPLQGRQIGGFGGPVPPDVWVLLGIIFGTFSLNFFEPSAWLPAALRLTPLVWQSGFIWQLVTYPFIGVGAPGLWFLVGLLILFLFSRDVLYTLGRRRFWRLLVYAAGVAGLTAVAIGLAATFLTGALPPSLFSLMQGQHMLLVILIAAFATLYADATIYLFFVLPIRARWFLPLEILFAFMGFLSSKDLAGFIAICVAVGFTYGYLTGWRRQGWIDELRLRVQHLWFRLRLALAKRQRGLRVVPGGGEKKRPGGGGGNGRTDHWVN